MGLPMDCAVSCYTFGQHARFVLNSESRSYTDDRVCEYSPNLFIGLAMGISVFVRSMMCLVWLALLAYSQHAGYAHDLRGTVTDTDGKPIANARVDIATGGPKSGPSIFCPTCYSDCSKATHTSEDGSFLIPALAPELNFSVLITKPGMRVVHTKRLDPSKGPYVIQLRAAPITATDRVVRGRLVGVGAVPVVGALVTPVLARKAPGSISYQVDDVEITVTDEKGEFAMALPSQLAAVCVELNADGYCSQYSDMLEPSEAYQEIAVGVGAKVTGRIMAGTLPAAFEPVAIVQLARSPGKVFIKAVNAITNASGEYVFEHLPPSQKYVIYTPRGIESTGRVIATQLLDAPAEGDTLRLEDIKSMRGFTLAGKVESSASLPKDVKIVLGRALAWDWVTQDLGADGSFSFANLPPEPYSLKVVADGLLLDEDKQNYQCCSETSIALRLEKDIDDLSLHLRKFRPGEPGLFKNSMPEKLPRGKQTLYGKVVDREGKPLEGVSISFASTEFWGLPRTIRLIGQERKI